MFGEKLIDEMTDKIMKHVKDNMEDIVQIKNSLHRAEEFLEIIARKLCEEDPELLIEITKVYLTFPK